jgi:Ca-activated chloride channel family protein
VPALEVLVHEEPHAGTRYFLVLVSPPAAADALSTVDREITLLVDHSGSMAGPSGRPAAGRSAASWPACGRSTRSTWACSSPPATGWRPGRYLAPRRTASGRSASCRRTWRAAAPDWGPALEQALHRPRSLGERARHVLLLTDAQVSDEGRLLQLAETEAARPGRRASPPWIARWTPGPRRL